MNEPALSIRHLAVGYGRHRVLDDIDLTVRHGEWFCLLGPNGSGKSTLLRAIAGQLVPTAGTICIAGDSMSGAPERARRRLGYAHPPERLPGLLTGRQCLEVYAAAHDLPDIGTPIFELAAEFRLSAALDRFVDTYSLGMRQKLAALLALIADPELIVLDEAFNGLDPASALILKRHLEARIASGRCAVVLATHALDIVLRHATAAGLLADGALVRTWNRAELEALRRADPQALEIALAAASTAAPTA
jgi:ABC-2 type transport system ATP-binding protein